MADFTGKDTFSSFLKDGAGGESKKKGGGGASSRLPKMVEGCKYDPENRQWVAPKYFEEYLEDGECSLVETKYLIEESLTARATCRNCGIKIEKQALRVAFPGVIPRPDWGAGNFYLHASCAHALESLTKEQIEKCYGYASLTEKQKAEVRKGFKKPKANEDALELAKVDDKGEKLEIQGGAVQVRKIKPAKQPDTLKGAKMLPFQLEGLAWMKEQEAGPVKGGILADEMGMGKTIQAIALLLDQRQADRLRGPTLIICPMGAVMQVRFCF